ncbi:hypothetical protein BC833DRAFT_585168 [Globomyces pollinis-pini]|nr:hypothetical protein BC833DRAFT_585168 [Globomyces pollinis-pini]
MATVQVINFKGTFYTINWKLMIALATLFGLVDLALSFMPYFSFEITDILSVVELIVVTVTVAIQLLACTLSVQELNKQKTARQKNLTTNTFKLMEYKRHKADQIMMNFILSFMILNAATWVPYIISGLLFYARICGDNFINQIFYFTYNGVGAIRGCLQAIIINRAYSKVEFTSEQDNDNEDDVNDDKKKKSLEDATTQIQIDEKVTKYDNASTQIEILNPFQNESFGSNTPILEDAVQVSSPRQQIPSVWSPTTDSISFNRSMNRKVRVRVVDSFLPTLSGSNALNYPTNSILLMNQNHLSKIDSKVLSLDSPTRFNSFVRPVSIITPKLDMSFVSVPRHKAVDAIRNSNQSYAIKIDSPLATGDIYDSYLYENK